MQSRCSQEYYAAISKVSPFAVLDENDTTQNIGEVMRGTAYV